MRKLVGFLLNGPGLSTRPMQTGTVELLRKRLHAHSRCVLPGEPGDIHRHVLSGRTEAKRRRQGAMYPAVCRHAAPPWNRRRGRCSGYSVSNMLRRRLNSCCEWQLLQT